MSLAGRQITHRPWPFDSPGIQTQSSFHSDRAIHSQDKTAKWGAMERCHKAQTAEYCTEITITDSPPCSCTPSAKTGCKTSFFPNQKPCSVLLETGPVSWSKESTRESEQRGKGYPCAFLYHSELKCTSGQIIWNTMSSAEGSLW